MTEEEAHAACEIVHSKDDRADCVYDVVALNDLDMVGMYLENENDEELAKD